MGRERLKMKKLFTTSEWTPELLESTWEVIDKVGRNVFKLDYHPPQFEIVSYEQMLDNYSSLGLPNMYHHWSFGKNFLRDYEDYRAGTKGLAYEMVINTNPTIAYIMENNTMTMQALVMAHASCGHAHVFKNNYLFKEWTDPDFILPYLTFAKNYIKDCEIKYGAKQVEVLLDAAHSLQEHGIDRFKRKYNRKPADIQARKQEWLKHLDDSLKANMDPEFLKKQIHRIEDIVTGLDDDPRGLPEENILYFLEKNSPTLKTWQREVLRIVRTIRQYFYPQRLTKVLNEGFASFVHYHIMTYLYDNGGLTEGSYMEFLHSHTSVCYQPNNYPGFNPYALGFAIFRDIERICKNPTAEDKYWFPEFAGEEDWMEVCKEAVELYRDDSFIAKFLSPKVIRDFRMVSILDDADDDHYHVVGDSTEENYREIKQQVADSYKPERHTPRLEVTDVDWEDTRTLTITHHVTDNKLLDTWDADIVLHYLRSLWGYDVNIEDEEDEE